MLIMTRPDILETAPRMQHATASMIAQLAADLAECVEASWMMVAIEGRAVYGASSRNGSARAIASIRAGNLAGRLELGPRLRGDYSPEELELAARFADHFSAVLARDPLLGGLR